MRSCRSSLTSTKRFGKNARFATSAKAGTRNSPSSLGRASPPLQRWLCSSRQTKIVYLGIFALSCCVSVVATPRIDLNAKTISSRSSISSGEEPSFSSRRGNHIDRLGLAVGSFSNLLTQALGDHQPATSLAHCGNHFAAFRDA